jgi:hypothetical protein
MRCFPKPRRGAARTDFANIFIPLETRGTSPLPSEKQTRASAYLLRPSVFAAEPWLCSTLASIGKAAQSVKQNRLQSITRRKKEFSSGEPMNRMLVPNWESKASAYLGRSGTNDSPTLRGQPPNCRSVLRGKMSLDARLGCHSHPHRQPRIHVLGAQARVAVVPSPVAALLLEF